MLTIALCVVIAAAVFFRVALPRLANRAFTAGNPRQAARIFGWLRALAFDRARRATLDVSLSGCLCGAGDFAGALAVLGRAEPLLGLVASTTRAALLNNRAYATVRSLGATIDALADADEAVRLRPDVASFRHTRGLALLASGRVDDAITELDTLWARQRGDQAPPLFEAERCFDLGVAWVRRGERAYARDYLDRAQRIAPGSHWATKAAALQVM